MASATAMASTSSPPTGLDRTGSTPFLLKLFYRTGAFHRPDEFASHTLPPYIPVYTWSTCTLAELAHHLAATDPAVLPDPAIGTRLVFRLVFADTRGGPNQPVKYMPKDLGSIVIGGTAAAAAVGLRAEEGDEDRREGGGDGVDTSAGADVGAEADADAAAEKTLADVKFVVGDYVSCAILPPDPITGEVAPAGSARSSSSILGVEPPPPRRDNNALPRGSFGRGGRGSGGGGGGRFGGGPRARRYGDRDRDRDRPRQREQRLGADGFPQGEWRRGETLPELSERPRARTRW